MWHEEHLVNATRPDFDEFDKLIAGELNRAAFGVAHTQDDPRPAGETHLLVSVGEDCGK